jgi:hypothetical protein
MNKTSPIGSNDQCGLQFQKVEIILHSPAGNAHRNPMFVFVFVGALFQFDAQRPLFVPLFQLPPEYSPRERA